MKLTDYSDRQVAWLGDHNKKVETENIWRFYARLPNGKVVVVRNAINVPAVADLRVWIAKGAGSEFVIIKQAEDQPTHNSTHVFGDADHLTLPNKNRKCSWCSQRTAFDEPCRYCGGPE